MFCLFALLGALTATAQIMPTASGSCSVAPSGVHGCSWLSAVNLRNATTSKTTGAADDSLSTLIVTRFVLAPGAPLDSQTIVGGEVLIVSRKSGEVINEKKSPPSLINVYDGLVMLMPKDEPYLLRNTGKENLELLLIEVRK
jgi:hypothetical protein